MYTIPTIVTSDDLSKRAYVTFYLNGSRVREYNGNPLGLKISPNRAVTLTQRTELLERLRFEYHKALEGGNYPLNKTTDILAMTESNLKLKYNSNAQDILTEALADKEASNLSRTYKRDLRIVLKQFLDFITPEEANGNLESIQTVRIEKFLGHYGSTGTYYMNKRRNLSILFASAGRLIDKQVKAVKETQRRRSKAKLHRAYEKQQLKPILEFLKDNYPNLYLCCLLTYGSWLRPHEEIRLLTRNSFKNDFTEVHLSGDENKGGRVRVVYIPDYIRTVIAPILTSLKIDDNLFSLQSEPFNESYFNTQWSRAWKKLFDAGLIYKDQTIYSFRHTAAIDLYRRTKDVYLLQKLLGHSTIVVTLKYLRSLGELNSQELKDAAPALE